MRDFILKSINEREQKISTIVAQIKNLAMQQKELEIELRVYKEIFDKEQSESINEFIKTTAGPLPRVRSRMSDVWKKILQDIGRSYPDSLNTEDIRTISLKYNSHIDDNTLRSQLSVYVSRGFLSRPLVGRYLLTKQGAAVSGYGWSEAQTDLAYKNEQNP